MIEEKDTTPIELQTFTPLWRVERKLYRIYDVNLPFPISLYQMGLVLLFGIPWILFVRFIGVPFAPPFGHLIWLAPPAAVGWYANKPLMEGKTIIELATSQLKFLIAPRTLTKFASPNRETEILLTARVWKKKNSGIIKPMDVEATEVDIEQNYDLYYPPKKKLLRRRKPGEQTAA